MSPSKLGRSLKFSVPYLPDESLSESELKSNFAETFPGFP